MSSCLPIAMTSSSLVGSESRSTMLAASLAADVPLFMARPTSAWASAGRVVRAVAGHRDEVAVGLLLADEGDLVLGLGLGDEVVDAGLPGDRRRGPRVVAGDHDRPDAHPAELGEALDEALLDGVLELDQPEDAAVARGSRAASRPGRRSRSASARTSAGIGAVEVRRDGVDGALEDRARRRSCGRRSSGSRPGTGSPRRSSPASAAKPGVVAVAARQRRARPRRSRASSTIERPSGRLVADRRRRAPPSGPPPRRRPAPA